MRISSLSPGVWLAAIAALAVAGCASTPSAETPAAPSASASAPAARSAAPAPAPAAFAVCGACHGTTAGAPPGVGPNLFGVFGRKAGAAAGYDYSDAMKASPVVWSKETLAAFLTDSNKVIPGNNMDYPGISDAATVSAIVDHLATLK